MNATEFSGKLLDKLQAASEFHRTNDPNASNAVQVALAEVAHAILEIRESASLPPCD